MHSPFFPLPQVAPLGEALIAPLMDPFGRGAGRALAHSTARSIAPTTSGHLSYDQGRVHQALCPRNLEQGPLALPLGIDGWTLLVGDDGSGVFVQPPSHTKSGGKTWLRVAPIAVTLARHLTLDGVAHPVPWWAFSPRLERALSTPTLARLRDAWMEEARAWGEACSAAPTIDAGQHPFDGPNAAGQIPGWCLPNSWMPTPTQERLSLLLGLLVDAAPALTHTTPLRPVHASCMGGRVDAAGHFHDLSVSLRGIGSKNAARLYKQIRTALALPPALEAFPLRERVAPTHVFEHKKTGSVSAHRMLERIRDARAFLEEGTIPAFLRP